MGDRISTITQTNQLLEANMRLQSNYGEAQTQLSTGLKSQTFLGIARETNQLLNLESEYKRAETQTENAKLALSRTESAYSALDTVLTAGQNFLADLSATISGFGLSDNNLVTTADASLAQTEGALNTQVAGRYIFAGAMTQTAPIDLTGYGGAVIPSAADTSYYQGDSYVQNVQASDSFTVNYGVTADNQWLEQIIRAYDLAMTTPGDNATLQEAYTLLDEGIFELANMKAEVSQNAQIIQSQIDANAEEMVLIDNTLSDLRDADIAEVSVRLSEIEAQLEASYSVTTKILQLSIVNYI